MNVLRYSRLAPYACVVLILILATALPLAFAHAAPGFQTGTPTTPAPTTQATPPGTVTGAGATPPGTVTGSATGNTSTGLQNPLNNIKTLPDLLDAIIGGIIEIGSIFLVLMLVYVGFLFVNARGNEEKIREARSALVWTVIGGLILLGAAAIKAVILATANTL